MQMTRHRETSIARIFLVSSCLIATLAITHSSAISVIWDHFSFVCSPNQSFDSAEWKRTDEGMRQRKRAKMVDDLLNKHRLAGMTTTEIQNLLGIPNSVEGSPVNDYVYYLGPERAFPGLESEYLHVRFRDGKVEKVSIQKPERSRD